MMKVSKSVMTIVIMSFYLFLLIFSIDGFSNHGVITRLIDSLSIVNVYAFFLFSIVIVIITSLVAFIWLVKYFNEKSVFNTLLLSVILGVGLFLISSRVSVISNYIYSFYILHFYSGVYYEGEGKVQQSMSFIVRYLSLCFLIGGMGAFSSQKIIRVKK